VTGSKADLYSPSYFKKVAGERPAVNPFERWVNGKLFVFGIASYPTGDQYRFCLDLTKLNQAHPFSFLSDDPFSELEIQLNEIAAEALTEQYIVEHPFIPPSYSYISWKYRSVVKKHQFHIWAEDNCKKCWVPITKTETQYLDSNNKPIVPERVYSTEDEGVSQILAEELTAYYYNNKWEFPRPTTCDFECPVGDSIILKSKAISDEVKAKYGQYDDTFDQEVVVSSVDITKAQYYDCDSEHDDSLMGYWLGKLSSFPKMFSVDQNENIIASYGTHKSGEPFIILQDYEYRHSLPDAVFDFKKPIVNRATTLPICNGLFCYPRIIDGRIFASEGQRLSYNEKDRNRRWVLMDFSSVGGCTFKHLSEFGGPLSELIIPKDEDGKHIFDPETQSLLLCLRGRLFTPDEFEVVHDRILLDWTKYTAIHELDRMLCRGDFVDNTSFLERQKHNVQPIKTQHSELINAIVPTKDEKFTLKGRPTADEVFFKGKKYLYKDAEHPDPVEIPDIDDWYGQAVSEYAATYTPVERGFFEPDKKYYTRIGNGKYQLIEQDLVGEAIGSYYDDELAELAVIRSMLPIGNRDYTTADIQIRLDIFLDLLNKLCTTDMIFVKTYREGIEILEEVRYYVKFFGDFYEAKLPDEVYENETPINEETMIPVDLIDPSTGEFVELTEKQKIELVMKVNEEGKPLFNKFYEQDLKTVRHGFTDKTIEGKDLHETDDHYITTHSVKEIDLKNDDNSFVVIINKPGLRVIRHQCYNGPWSMTKMRWGADAKTGTMKVDFDRQVRGLLFDEASRSVIDYTRETQSLTFYADKFRRWGIANVSANWSSLIAIADESADNSMSARGFVVTDCTDYKYDQIVWPHLSVLDFTFRD